jgi:nicotinamidase-related amidase
VFDAAGYGQTGGFARRPALLVVDVTYDFCGDRPEPILQSIERFATEMVKARQHAQANRCAAAQAATPRNPVDN